MTRLLLIICLLLFAATNSMALDVHFNKKASVDGVSIVLADIADLSEKSELAESLGSQIVGQSPAPGQAVVIDAKEVIRQLAPTLPRIDEVFWNGSATVEVSRNYVTIPTSRILGIIDEYLKSQSRDLPQAVVKFTPKAQPIPFYLPVGKLSYKVIPSNPKIIGSRQFSLIFKVDDRVRKNMSVRGKLEVLLPIAVTTTEIRKGTIITDGDITMAIRDVSKIKNPCLNQQQILGKRAVRTLRPGRAVALNHVEFPPVVRKGELVKMVVLSSGMMITATGIAKKDGRIDETIKVQNTSSNKTVYCRVAAPGIVEVRR